MFISKVEESQASQPTPPSALVRHMIASPVLGNRRLRNSERSRRSGETQPGQPRSCLSEVPLDIRDLVGVLGLPLEPFEIAAGGSAACVAAQDGPRNGRRRTCPPRVSERTGRCGRETNLATAGLSPARPPQPRLPAVWLALENRLIAKACRQMHARRREPRECV